MLRHLRKMKALTPSLHFLYPLFLFNLEPHSMTTFQLVSGEEARVEIIPRNQAISILSKPAPRRTWFGEKYRSVHRTSRGPGGAADYLNIGLVVTYKGKNTCRAVMRFGTAP